MVARNPTCLNRSLTKATKHRGFYQFGAEAELLARFLSEVNRRILQSPEELLTYEDSEVESETNMEYMDYTPWNQHGPWNFRPFQKETIVFHFFSFQVLFAVSFREGIWSKQTFG